MFHYLIHLSITLGLALLLTGCAASNAQIASEIPPMHTVSEFSDDESVSHTHDPWEGFNKGMYKFNYQFDRFVFLPVVAGYETIVPRFAQTGVSNFFANIREVRTLYNSILQAKGKKSLVTLGRFLTNSTIGIGGLFAQPHQVEHVDRARAVIVPKQRKNFLGRIDVAHVFSLNLRRLYHAPPHLLIPR